MVFLSLVVGIATIFAGVIGYWKHNVNAVKERTNELGIRRALGATPAEVKIQIVLESVFLTIIAGIIGIIVGSISGIIIDYIHGAQFMQSQSQIKVEYEKIKKLLFLLSIFSGY
mgnify:CR=1 FL=1